MTKSEISKLDALWSKYVKEKAGYKCEYCQEEGRQLNPQGVWLEAAHIIGRTFRSTRWLLYNGMCLCSGCHSGYDQHRPIEKSIREQVIGLPKYEELCKTKQVIAKNQDYNEIRNKLMADFGEAQAIALFGGTANEEERPSNR